MEVKMLEVQTAQNKAEVTIVCDTASCNSKIQFKNMIIKWHSFINNVLNDFYANGIVNI